MNNLSVLRVVLKQKLHPNIHEIKNNTIKTSLNNCRQGIGLGSKHLEQNQIIQTNNQD